ncbi:MAG: hypothetical protein P0Y48_14050 [Candidatus Microbacterium phytovorans]|uniref:Uncharacterized protein n=1 Tax=Candidatus Microbacterium phytovorans TaxID=3121374 RepID=A0AAJ5W2L4_9MICO|nr:hypothetical protein [Microbacterium sp.]WEK13561.1 MAG: hypothetical protein P0Y48_14050 [Microbacterium sp.]
MSRRPALELTLPGDWHPVPLGEDAAIDEDVASFVREHFGRRDDQAVFRAQQRERLRTAARRARDAGAAQFQLSLTVPGGVGLAATVAEYHPALPLGTATEPPAVADALVRVLAGGASSAAEAGDHWDAFAAAGGAVFDRGDGLVLRTTRRRAPVDDDDLGATTVDYWLTRPGRPDAVLVSFTTALVDLEPVMVELFDAIVSAASWAAEPGEPATSLRAELQG